MRLIHSVLSFVGLALIMGAAPALAAIDPGPELFVIEQEKAVLDTCLSAPAMPDMLFVEATSGCDPVLLAATNLCLSPAPQGAGAALMPTTYADCAPPGFRSPPN